jgi:hypothetical protein
MVKAWKLWLLYCAVLCSLTSPSRAADAQCDFSYTEHIKRTVVRPVIEKFSGGLSKYFDLNKPHVSSLPRNRAIVVMEFTSLDEKKTSSIELYYDTCEKKAWIPLGPIE